METSCQTLPSLTYASYLNSTNDFTKFSEADITDILNINVEQLKNECDQYNTSINLNKTMVNRFDLIKADKLATLQKYYDEQFRSINDEYDSNLKQIQYTDPSIYVNRHKLLKQIEEFIAYRNDTDKLLRSFDTCRLALKNDHMNDSFIAQLKTEKMDAFMNKSLFIKGLIHYVKSEKIPVDFKNYLYDDLELKYLKESELSYSVPYNMQTYEDFVQYDDVCPTLLNKKNQHTDGPSLRFEPHIKNAKPEDFKKPVPNSQLLSTDNVMYKTPYYDVNTTYQSVIIPDKIDERLIESRGSLLETGSNSRSSSTDYWLLQTALNINGSMQI